MDNQCFVYIHLLVTWTRRRKRVTTEIISWSISTKTKYETRLGWNSQPLDLQLDLLPKLWGPVKQNYHFRFIMSSAPYLLYYFSSLYSASIPSYLLQMVFIPQKLSCTLKIEWTLFVVQKEEWANVPAISKSSWNPVQYWSKYYGPRSDCSIRSSLTRVHNVCFLGKVFWSAANEFMQQMYM